MATLLATAARYPGVVAFDGASGDRLPPFAGGLHVRAGRRDDAQGRPAPPPVGAVRGVGRASEGLGRRLVGSQADGCPCGHRARRPPPAPVHPEGRVPRRLSIRDAGDGAGRRRTGPRLVGYVGEAYRHRLHPGRRRSVRRGERPGPGLRRGHARRRGPRCVRVRALHRRSRPPLRSRGAGGDHGAGVGRQPAPPDLPARRSRRHRPRLHTLVRHAAGGAGRRRGPARTTSGCAGASTAPSPGPRAFARSWRPPGAVATTPATSTGCPR